MPRGKSQLYVYISPLARSCLYLEQFLSPLPHYRNLTKVHLTQSTKSDNPVTSSLNLCLYS
jgi:hypothetical protein